MMYTYGGMAGLVLQQTPDMNIGVIAFPGDTADKTHTIVQAAGGVGIATTSQKTALAKEFLNFWSEPEQADQFAMASSIISANQAATGKIEGTYADIATLFTNNKILPDITALWPTTSFNEQAGSSLQGLFTGQKTVDQVLADLDSYFDA